MLKFALLGAGRIGRMHAANLAANPNAALASVFDVNAKAASAVANEHGGRACDSVDAALNDVDAALIASSTDTHVDLITAAAKAGKAVLCEKPIDLDASRVSRCWQEVKDCGVPIQIGFNRRYDPGHLSVVDAVRAGEIGQLEQVIISSRDPAPPPAEYLKVSGGLLRDMMIHDFDLARFVLDSEPVEVFAMASNRVDPQIGELGDIDTAMVTLATADGTLCHINNSRRAVYGYDQRLEAFGANGMVLSDNLRPTAVKRYTATSTEVCDPLLNFFIERYHDAYVAEINDFIDSVESGRVPNVTFEDGQRALALADAAYRSLATGAKIEVS